MGNPEFSAEFAAGKRACPLGLLDCTVTVTAVTADEDFEMSVNKALRALISQHLSMPDFEEYYAQIDAEKNDRGAAILSATFLEIRLEYALSRSIPDAGKLFDRLFRDEGPLSSFDDKIIMCEAMRIIGPVTKKNVTTIKLVRNVFAHASRPITFSTPEVVAACDTLVRPLAEHAGDRSGLRFSSAREKYVTTCELTAEALANYALGCNWARPDLVPSMQEGKLVALKPEPLP